MASKIDNPCDLTPEKARVILTSVLDALSLPENAVRLGEAKDNAGNDMLKMMQYIFPIVVQIQMGVIKNFGFPEGREGMMQFAKLIRKLEQDDEEVAHLHAQVRAHFLPPVTITTETTTTTTTTAT